MSLSVNGSNNNNPLAIWQSLFGQGPSAGGSTTGAQSDPLSELLATIGQATGLATANTSSSTGGTPATTGSTSPQFGPQTLQALLDLQVNGSQSSGAQADGSGVTSSTDPNSAQQVQRGHHHRGLGGRDSASDLFASAESATSHTTANPNGSSTTSITYADGSSVTMTTAAPSNSSGSATTATAGASGVSGNNFLERLIQMQSQLVNTNAAQSITTA